MAEQTSASPSLTTRQAQYLTFIREFTRLHGHAPAELEIARFFRVSAPSVHSMLVRLESLGAIAREPGTARSVRVLTPPAASTVDGEAREPGVDVGRSVVTELFSVIQDHAVSDQDFVPMLGAVARGVAASLLAAGRSAVDATKARRAVLEFAAESYARVCAINDPEEADEEEDTGRFWSLLEESAG